MKKYICTALCTILIALSFAACGEQAQQTLKIDDVELHVGDPAVDLHVTFGDESRAEPISYNYDAGIITIRKGAVSAVREGQTTVTATARTCSATFTVTCLPAREMISVSDMYAWVGYPPSEISPVLADEIASETVEYQYDESKISIENGCVTALEECDTEVTATAGGYSATFIVTCKAVDRTQHLYYMHDDWEAAATTFRAQWNAYGTDRRTTLFIGDSFFDCRYFWTDFYDTYGAYDAQCFGIGGTTSHTWELLADTLLKDVYAKNIVVNVGNNNVYNDCTETEQTVEDLQRFFTLLHGRMPDAEIYFYSITARNFDNALDPRRTVRETNDAMADWCAGKSWITFLDLQNVMTADKLFDNIHPYLYNYCYFTDALAQTNIQIEEKI